MRISTTGMSERLLVQLQQAQRRLAHEQERVATGRRLNRPSDDAFGTARLLEVQTRIDNNEQYLRNIAVANTDYAATEAALTSLHDVLARASELAVQAASDNLTATDRSNIGLEVAQLLNQAIDVGNTRHAGRYLFAGHQTSTVTFTEDVPGNPTVITYNGDAGVIQREVAQGERVTVNITGTTVWPGVFSTLIQFRDDLMSNNFPGIQNASATIATQIEGELNLRSQLGAKARRVELAEFQLEDEAAMLNIVKSDMQDIDLSDAIVKLQIQETAYEAALGVTGRTLNLSLLNFLR
jgi:flagellar hook-associated protein 3 FlgL